MIDRTIDWCTSHRSVVLVVTLALSLWGWWALQRIPLDAVPDLSDPQVIVLTEWPGHSPDLIEDQVTYPIITALIPTPGVQTVRGFTDFGVSYIYVVFNDGADIDSARRHVLEQIQRIRSTFRECGIRVIGERGDPARVPLRKLPKTSVRQVVRAQLRQLAVTTELKREQPTA